MKTTNSQSTVLITGASSGIGKATAKLFHKRGWNVVATMRSPEKEQELAALPRVLCTRLDVTDQASIEQAVSQAITTYGGIDVVVNNAGYGLVGPFEAATEEDIRRQLDTNVVGVMRVTQAVLPHFRERGRGTFVNISSMGGRVTFPYYSVYHASKWAVEGFSESLQYELHPLNIKVKLVEPGPIKTDFYDRSMTVLKKDGLTVYDQQFNTMMPRMQQAGVTGAHPETVARAVYQAATDTSSRMRYPGDRYARIILWTRRLLPERMYWNATLRQLGR